MYLLGGKNSAQLFLDCKIVISSNNRFCKRYVLKTHRKHILTWTQVWGKLFPKCWLVLEERVTSLKKRVETATACQDFLLFAFAYLVLYFVLCIKADYTTILSEYLMVVFHSNNEVFSNFGIILFFHKAACICGG